ncbi:MAG: MATE family efflux transporter [Alphaproteobacteria bacterium]|nr:MATE family efflux transporter [Alphaproteobacteria bacterium]
MSSRPSVRIEVPYKEIIRLAWPASVAASVTPLLGAVDVWALGRSERPLDIAAIGLGSVIFSLAYWTFGFIRMSVAGLAAQAAGAGDEKEARAALARGALLGAAIGLVLVVFQNILGALAFAALKIDSAASHETFAAARVYFDIRIWGAPFALATYAAFGWLSARRRTDYLMAASLVITGINIALDYWFVVGLGWGAAGVAAGTLIAEIAGFVICAFFVVLILARNDGVFAHWSPAALVDPDKIRRTVSVNRDIFIRTVLLAFSYSWFVQRSGQFGDVALAANQTLLQLFLFTGLALDGTAIAAETLVGGAIGDRDSARGAARYRSAVRRTFMIAGTLALMFSAAYLIFGDALIALLTKDETIRAAARTFMPWVIISPLAVVGGFQLDGVFIGATRAREMRDAMFVTAPLFVIASIALAGPFGNHGLWASFTIYFLLRGATLIVYLPRIAADFAKR